MLNVHSPADPSKRACAAPASCPGVDPDWERAPVVFGWLLYRQDCYAGAVHLETLYRLDRVGGGTPELEASLQPSVYYGQSVEALRALLRAQQHRRLPPTPRGCHWLGPQLVTEVSVPATHRLPPAPPPPQDEAVPAERGPRLAFARAIARRLLHGPEGA